MPFPVEEKFIREAEEKLGVRLPDDYCARMMASNGGTVEAIGDHWNLFPIYDTSSQKRIKRTFNDIVRETKNAHEWRRYPANSVAIAHNGSGDLLLLMPEQKELRILGAAVWFWDHETGQIQKVADWISDLPTLR